jgi:hypothetical protein
MMMMEDEAPANLPEESGPLQNPFVEGLEDSSPMIQVHHQN